MYKTTTLLLIAASLLLTACSTDTNISATLDPTAPGTESSPTAVQTGTSDQQSEPTGAYVIPDTGQTGCYDNQDEIICPQEGEAFFGQDGNYQGIEMQFVDNGDGTITDLNTGLMWQQALSDKMNFAEAVAGAETFDLAGYYDWRLPTIKELYSLIDFTGYSTNDESTSVPYLDTDYFEFTFGTATGERLIDAQFFSGTEYLGTTMNGLHTVFGVNFADGRIKGYGLLDNANQKQEYIRYVRGNPDYGINDFADNGDGTITDQATGLTWAQADSGEGMLWEDALAFCQDLSLAGYDDWRLPNAKELQSIVDYSYAPDAADPVQQGKAINPLFQISEDANHFWTGTTHREGNKNDFAAYVAFDMAMGYLEDRLGNTTYTNVHGAGAQRSDPKTGDPADYPTGHGPQGDEIIIYNYVRCVRGGSATLQSGGELTTLSLSAPSNTANMQEAGNPLPDLEAAAATLNIPAAALEAALGDPTQGQPDLQVAAQRLNIPLSTLEEALGIPGPPTAP